MATIYRKTGKAQVEIDTRAHRLTPRTRTALILVDGKRTDEDLRLLIPQQADETLSTLLDQGFIEVVAELDDRPRPAPAPQQSAEPQATAPVGSPFEQVRREAVRAFTDGVGPMAETLAIKMEKAPNADELRPLLELARQILGSSRGGAAAEQFAARFIGAPATA